jgi:hypothetical protein
MRSIFLVLLLSGCGAPALTVANHVGLVVQSAALACDWGQTRRAAEIHWETETKFLYEKNAVLGPTPTTSAVDAYFIGMIGLGALAWRLLPSRYKLLASIAIIAIQTDAVSYNLGYGGHDLGICGVGTTDDRR